MSTRTVYIYVCTVDPGHEQPYLAKLPDDTPQRCDVCGGNLKFARTEQREGDNLR